MVLQNFKMILPGLIPCPCPSSPSSQIIPFYFHVLHFHIYMYIYIFQSLPTYGSFVSLSTSLLHSMSFLSMFPNLTLWVLLFLCPYVASCHCDFHHVLGLNGFNSSDIFSSSPLHLPSPGTCWDLQPWGFFLRLMKLTWRVHARTHMRTRAHTHASHKRKHLIFSMSNEEGESFQKMKHK